MFGKHMVLVLVAVTVSSWAHSAELTDFRMKAPVEPTYQSDSQGYCILVFGEGAEFRSWIVRDGQRFFVDRNGNGKLTDAGEVVDGAGASYCDLGEIHSQDDGQDNGQDNGQDDGRNTNLRIYTYGDGTFKLRANIAKKGLQMVGVGKAIRPSFGKTTETAPVIHFDGPMTLGQYGKQQTIPRDTDKHSYRVTSLQLMIGTPGIGEGTFAAYHCKCRRNKTLRGSAVFPTSENLPLIARLDYQMKG